jgi:hypothetical protein
VVISKGKTVPIKLNQCPKIGQEPLSGGDFYTLFGFLATFGDMPLWNIE